MGVKNIGPKSWVGGLVEDRREAQVAEAKAHGAKARANGAAPAAEVKVPPRLVDRLGVAGVPEKVATKHAESLKVASADIAAIASFTNTKLEPWRARAVHRIVEQFYKALGVALDAAPAASRGEVAKASVSALRGLLTKIGPADHLGSAASAAVALFELGGREAAKGVLTTSPKELPNAMQDACAAVLATCETLSGRPGLGTALNIHPVLVEQLERAEKQLTPEMRRATWSQVTRFLAETGPLDGFDQDIAANLAQALQKALEKKPDAGLEASLQSATKLFRAPYRAKHEEILEQLANRRVPGILVKSPGRPAFDEFNAALEKVALAHPTAKEPLNRAIYEVRAKAVEILGQMDPRQLDVNPWPAITKLVERVGTTEAAPAFFAWLMPILDQAQYAYVSKALVTAAEAEKPSALATRLAEVDHAYAGWENVEVTLSDQLKEVAKLPAPAAFAWTFAQSQAIREGDQFMYDSGRELLKLAKEGGKDDLLGQLSLVGTRMREVLPTLRNYNFGAGDATNERATIAAALARASAAAPNLADAAWPAYNVLTTLEGRLPRAVLRELVGPQRGSDPGIWSLIDPTVHRRHDVNAILGRILGALSNSPVGRGTPEVQTDAARFALHLTDVLSKLDGEYEIPLQRIEQDVQSAFNRPSALHYALRAKKPAALRSSEKPGVAEFLASHPEYPLELALTAGRHLTPEQGAWLLDRLQKAVGRDTKRQLRDLVFACVTANKRQLIDALMTTEVPQKAISRAITMIAREYREGKVNELPWAELIRGFRTNKDPVGAIERKKVDASLAELGLEKLPAGQIDPAGLEEIAKLGEPIRYMMEYLVPGGNQDGMDTDRFRGPFLQVLENVAKGNWPAWRYENDVGKRQMSVWTPAQQAIWREETVTSMGAPVQADDSEARRAFALTKGLAKALKRDAKLEAPGVEGLGWNKPSLARLEERHAALAEAVRNVEKGSADHKKLGAELGAVRESLALLRLHFAIQGAGEQPAAALLAIRDAVGDALPALRRQGLDGAYAAATDVYFAARDLKASPRSGTYAVDEDRLDPLFTSTTGGCIHYTGFRRWAVASLAAEANEKIIRVYDGDNFVYRAIMKFHEIEIPGYKGPALWINDANVNGGGREEHRQLLLRHALRKAAALGVPVISSGNDFTQAAQAMGMKVEPQQVTLTIDGGLTDAIFTDYSVASDVRAGRGGQPKWTTNYHLTVVRK